MRKKSLSLMLAASVISGMFSVGVSANYGFDAPGLLKAHEVTVNEQGCTLNPEGTNEINLNFNTGNRKFVAFEVDKGVIELDRGYSDPQIVNDPVWKWLGGNTGGGFEINYTNSYKVTAYFHCGANSVTFDTIRQGSQGVWSCRLGDGQTVKPLIVVFKLRDGVTNANIRGKLVIQSKRDGSIPQEIPFAGTIGDGTDAAGLAKHQEKTTDNGLDGIYKNTLLPSIADGVTWKGLIGLTGDRKIKLVRKVFEPGPRPEQPKIHSVDVQEQVQAGQLTEGQVVLIIIADSSHAYSHCCCLSKVVNGKIEFTEFPNTRNKDDEVFKFAHIL